MVGALVMGDSVDDVGEVVVGDTVGSVGDDVGFRVVVIGDTLGSTVLGDMDGEKVVGEGVIIGLVVGDEDGIVTKLLGHGQHGND